MITIEEHILLTDIQRYVLLQDLYFVRSGGCDKEEHDALRKMVHDSFMALQNHEKGNGDTVYHAAIKVYLDAYRLPTNTGAECKNRSAAIHKSYDDLIQMANLRAYRV